jgi:RHS repeat-associated protein
MTITDYYVVADAMGNATAILDDEGNVLERRSYDVFGVMTCMTPDGTSVSESPTDVNVGFQGQIRDEDTGLYQMGYRWYNPALGRWLSRDPIGLKGGINHYASFGNTPNTRQDTWGLAWEITPGQGLHYNERNSDFSFAVDVGQNGELVAKPLKGHIFDAERSSKILKETVADKEKMDMLRKLVTSSYDERKFCDKSRLQKLGRALRLAGALGAIASVVDSRFPEAARAYLYAKNYNDKMAAATWVASEAVNAHMTESGALFIYNKLME